ncbi:hypothetical protein LTR84_011443 [Exophiala bonariae]|uniref:Carboxylic ester hydrolase n=1 Tax=Exophiala bonariae TaxID=1690606 RepID=A0AAV9MRQ6_9EURO|nr:hypothetical protein LTR84_011443 [Exophiala bonariae]
MSVIPVTAFIRSAFESLALTGQLLPTVLQADPRITYTGYIPEAHYPQENDTITSLPLLVAVHTTGRAGDRIIEQWKDFADANKVALITPLFPAFLQGPLDQDAYHFLGRPPPWAGEPAGSWLSKAISIPGGSQVTITPNDPEIDLRLDLLLLNLVKEVGERWPAIETDKFFLSGFSGGGQFSHRFFYLHPEKLEAVYVGAPGSTTQWNFTQNWPTGLQNWEDIFHKSLDVEKLRAVPVFGAVGSNDIVNDGLRLRKHVSGSDFGTDEETNRTRVSRLTTLVEGWQEAGFNASYTVVEGPGHEMERVNPPVEEWLRTQIHSWWAKRSVQKRGKIAADK